MCCYPDVVEMMYENIIVKSNVHYIDSNPHLFFTYTPNSHDFKWLCAQNFEIVTPSHEYYCFGVCVQNCVCISLRITIFTYVKLVEESSHSIDATCISLRFCLFERTKKWRIENSERMEN